MRRDPPEGPLEATALALVVAGGVGWILVLVLLAGLLPSVAWLDKAGGIPRGLWAAVAFPSTENTLALVDAILDVGLEYALDALGAVPIVGWIVQAVVSFGRALFSAMLAPDVAPAQRRYQLPWKRYSRDTDEEIVRDFLINIYGERVDWTPIWSPPTDGNDKGENIGRIFAPLDNKGDVAFDGVGLGAVPNTFRVAGLIQTRYTPPPGDRPRLMRYYNTGAALPWAPALTQTGDFRPAQGQASGQLWQQVQRPGGPDMYKVDTTRLDRLWRDWFEGFFDSLWALAAGDEWLADLGAPYIVSEQRAGELRLGIPWRVRPQPAPFVWPKIVTDGAARPGARTPCLWAEEDIPRNLRPGESPDQFWWPWRTEPAQVQAGPRYRAVDGHLVAEGPAVAPGGLRRGWRCVAWPSGQELLGRYYWPYDSLIKPALTRLRELQWSCLFRTFVCAYVRPLDLPGLPRHGAFADTALRLRCIEARAELLKSPQRFLVSYADAKLADPEYAALLAESGVPTTEVARQAMLRQLAATPGGGRPAPVPGEGPLPEPLHPQGGVAFGDVQGDGGGGGAPGVGVKLSNGARGSSSGSAVIAVLGTSLAGVALSRLLSRR